MNKKKGFVVSAVLYPLLVIFLALIMGLLSMSDVRKRILDRMKLEISDTLFDEESCSCETILNKLNYIIKNGVSSNGTSGGGSGGSNLTCGISALNVKAYELPTDIPSSGNSLGDVAVITETPISTYYVSSTVPKNPTEGTVWIVQSNSSKYFIESENSKIGVSYALQYIDDVWNLKKTFVYNGEDFELLYYVPVKDGEIDYGSTDINGEIYHSYAYTGKYQTFTALFSGYYTVELWGAQGGAGYCGGWKYGGFGAYTKGDIYLNYGDTLYIYVGGQGANNSSATSVSGGWNGGGGGQSATDNNDWAGAGGGATDIRLVPTSAENIWNEFDSLKSRIMVAAGGAGGAYNDSNVSWSGAGGGLYVDHLSINECTASQTNGYAFGLGVTNARTAATARGGGGGGYYGGNGFKYSDSNGGPGCGGSSYISGHAGANSLSEDSIATNIIHTGGNYHYSGYYFDNTVMIDGYGYQWNDKALVVSRQQPKPNASGTQQGNTGNGYAKITLKTVEYNNDDTIQEKADKLVVLYTNSNRYWEYTTPKAGTYKIELWGAQGGAGYHQGWKTGGNGAYTSGEINLKKGYKLYVYVGGRGQNNLQWSSVAGGWNGGGGGHAASDNDDWGGAGGGATDVRLTPTLRPDIWNETESLTSRIMVAAGGGGGAYPGASGWSGHGGGLYVNGLSSSNCNASQIGGNALGAGVTNSRVATARGGGGGGQYGGSGFNYGDGSGGHGCGGSSYISGHEGCIATTAAGLPKTNTYSSIADSISITYKSFTNTNMIDGAGHKWTTTYSSELAYMPSPLTPTNITGNPYGGYAKITYLGE